MRCLGVMLGIYMYNQLDDRGARPIVKTDSNRLKGTGRQGCSVELCVETRNTRAGQPIRCTYVWSTKGTDGERVRSFVRFRRHSLTHSHNAPHKEPTIAGGNDACGKIDDSWAELLIGRS